jgi:hypothetical protein
MAGCTPPSLIDIIERIKRIAIEPTNESTNMLEPDQWDVVLSRVSGTIYRGTERISSNALLNLLEVGPDPVLRMKVAQRIRAPMRRLGWTGPRAMRIPAENGHAAGASGYWRLPNRPPQPDASVEGEVFPLLDHLGQKKLPCRGEWFLPLPVELKTCTPATCSAWASGHFSAQTARRDSSARCRGDAYGQQGCWKIRR